jgi:hypothetical protein
MKYYYPDNLEAPPMLFFWTLGDISIILIGGVLSLFMAAFLHLIVPLVLTVTYSIVRARFFDFSVQEYLSRAGKYLLTGQQIFYWEQEDEI